MSETLIQAIIDYWGGGGSPRPQANGSIGFTADEGYSRYVIWLPGQWAELAEDSGRPFKKRVPKGKVLVRCLTDAPDCWWYVELDGSYTTMGGEHGRLDLSTPAPEAPKVGLDVFDGLMRSVFG